jgi:predicted enzyme related to lactoylglutathione lyase
MITVKGTFSSLSTDDLEKTKKFYSEIIGLKLDSDKMGLKFSLPGGGNLFIYPKENHKPATFTVLNLVVTDIDKTVDELVTKGVTFEIYEGFKQDEKGIARDPSGKSADAIAWFKDPAGNILSIIQEK